MEAEVRKQLREETTVMTGDIDQIRQGLKNDTQFIKMEGQGMDVVADSPSYNHTFFVYSMVLK